MVIWKSGLIFLAGIYFSHGKTGLSGCTEITSFEQISLDISVYVTFPGNIVFTDSTIKPVLYCEIIENNTNDFNLTRHTELTNH